MKYHLFTLAFLLAAVICYLLGLKTGWMLLVAIGLFLEGMVWMRSRRESKPKDS